MVTGRDSLALSLSNRLLSLPLDILFPKRCLGCGHGGAFICQDCQRKLPYLISPVCPVCGSPRLEAAICPKCLTGGYLDGVRSVFSFEGVIRRAIHEFKYHNLRAISGTLASFLAGGFSHYGLKGDLIVPVPLHPRRLKERGYNHSFLLARDFGELVGLEVLPQALVRTRYSEPQVSSKGLAERQHNVEGAFACYSDRIEEKHVILIDDVVTSGATLGACASALKKAGAAWVWGFTLAREL
jgi:ComF family protein